jgi:hypothetical protein
MVTHRCSFAPPNACSYVFNQQATATDKRGIYETELCGVGMRITLILFVVVDVWLDAWTWGWAIALIVVGLLGWLCVLQHGAARERARQRLKKAVRSKILALSPEQRSDLNALARRGDMPYGRRRRGSDRRGAPALVAACC